jgi:glutathione S-transferase
MDSIATMRWTHAPTGRSLVVMEATTMKLYFSPLACSLATRISLYEAGADARFVEIDPRTKQTEDGRDFRALYALALVPALEVDGGELLTENAAILQYVAALYPEARLAPTDAWGRARLQQWLCFIGTELHKAIYLPLLDKKAPAEAKAYALGKVESRLGWLAQQLEGRAFLLDHFTVADAYLYTVLNWSAVTPVELRPWPALLAYHAGLATRPSIARAFAEERKLYGRELERHARAAAVAP